MITELLEEDLHRVLCRLPRDVVKLLRKKPGLYLGGGFVRSCIAGEPVSDIDLFGPSKEMLESTAKDFALDRKARIHETGNAFTVLTPGRMAVQFIHRWTYSEPKSLLDSFDFTIAQAIIWWHTGAERWSSFISPFYYADLASKRLRYLSPQRHEDAGGSLLRVRKFLSRGYHIEAPSLAKVVARFARGVKQIGDLKEEWLGTVMTGLLREVDPLRVVDGLELADGDKPLNEIGADSDLAVNVNDPSITGNSSALDDDDISRLF